MQKMHAENARHNAALQTYFACDIETFNFVVNPTGHMLYFIVKEVYYVNQKNAENVN